MSKKKNLPILENITITDFAAEGKSVARIEGYVVFVPLPHPVFAADASGRLWTTPNKSPVNNSRLLTHWNG